MNWTKPSTGGTEKDDLIITYKENMTTKYHSSKEEEDLNHLKVIFAITPSSQILDFQKYLYQYFNQKTRLIINSISNTLIFKIYVSQPPTNLAIMCTI